MLGMFVLPWRGRDNAHTSPIIKPKSRHPPTKVHLQMHFYGFTCKKTLATNPAVSFLSARTATNDPFVYRLGLQVFILARRVRFPYGSPFFMVN